LIEGTMADPFVAEIRIFPFNFAPKGWAWCDGQLLPLSQNTALFSLLGTTYGGNGKSNFALPDLQGRAPMHPGQGPGLSLHDLGETGGSETVTLLESEIPSHSHALRASVEDATQGSLTPGISLAQTVNGNLYQTVTNTNVVNMNPSALAPAGGDQPHNNMQPFLTFYFNIALQGVFPPRG
jgi:microcystin-dependent protein